MQLNTPSLRQRLAASRESLLNGARRHGRPAAIGGLKIAGLLSAPAALAGTAPGDWDIKTALLMYMESDRVSAIEPVIEATRYFQNDRIFSTKLVLDALTGASANGAVPSNEFQTFTKPSGKGEFTTAPGDTPLDDTFRDTRVALSANWTQPLLKNLSGTFGLNASNEYDYLSLGASGLLNWDLNRKNTTLTFGLGVASDSISPEGGIPTPRAEAAFARGASAEDSETAYATLAGSDDAERAGRESSDSKLVTDLLLGVTQVIDRRTIAQFNYALSQSDGYQTDPFKFVSVVGDDGLALRQLYENRPDSRAKHSLFARVKRAIGQDDVLDLSYRYLWDDWGLTSHTLDSRYRWDLGTIFLQPHLRYYQQSATDFYTPYLHAADAVPNELSADYRLGDMSAITAGLELGYQTRQRGEWRVALEWYRQTPDEPSGKPGALQNLTVNPAVDAVMLRLNYDFGL